MIQIRDSEIERLIKNELGFDQMIDLGETGRSRTFDFSDGPHEVKERAAFSVYELAEGIDVMTEDDFYDAALIGIRNFLRDNAAEIKPALQRAAEEAKAALLAEPI